MKNNPSFWTKNQIRAGTSTHADPVTLFTLTRFGAPAEWCHGPAPLSKIGVKPRSGIGLISLNNDERQRNRNFVKVLLSSFTHTNMQHIIVINFPRRQNNQCPKAACTKLKIRTHAYYKNGFGRLGNRWPSPNESLFLIDQFLGNWILQHFKLCSNYE